jgi:hypothetical protein
VSHASPRIPLLAVADFTALVRATAALEWTGEQPLSVLTVDGHGFTYAGVSTPPSAYTPVRSTIHPRVMAKPEPADA